MVATIALEAIGSNPMEVRVLSPARSFRSRYTLWQVFAALKMVFAEACDTCYTIVNRNKQF